MLEQRAPAGVEVALGLDLLEIADGDEVVHIGGRLVVRHVS